MVRDRKMHCKVKSKFSLQQTPLEKMLDIPKNQKHLEIKVEKQLKYAHRFSHEYQTFYIEICHYQNAFN